jgi:hypothetical protein
MGFMFGWINFMFRVQKLKYSKTERFHYALDLFKTSKSYKLKWN